MDHSEGRIERKSTVDGSTGMAFSLVGLHPTVAILAQGEPIRRARVEGRCRHAVV